MICSIFDPDDQASEERFLDWLCLHLYATHASVRQLVDSGNAPCLVVHLRPGAPFNPSTTRLFVSIIHGTTIQVMDDWAAAGMSANERRIVHEIFRDFGFSTEERFVAERRAEMEGMS